MSPVLQTHGVSHPGLVRPVNEDHFLIAAAHKSVSVRQSNLDQEQLGRLRPGEAVLLAVADGVGGRSGGALASGIAVRATLEFIARAGGCYQRFDVEQENTFLEEMEASIREAHESILRDYGASDFTPATTLTLVMFVAPRAYVIHVGDTRAYYLRGSQLRRLTRDQTLGEYMLDSGAWTEEQVVRTPAAKALASAIGGTELLPAVGLIDLEPGDVLLLCSDGLTRHVEDAEIAQVLQACPEPRAACEELVRRALAGGGKDNVTVVVARWA
jgi:protein phosphatase